VKSNELVSQASANRTRSNDSCCCLLSHCLRGKRIAMVGGMDNLEAHYRRLVEQSGGNFCRHDGKCSRGDRRLEECIRNADLVVCPIRINSHFGTSRVKKVCRRYGITCCFPDSAGLGALRATLIQHFASNQKISNNRHSHASNNSGAITYSHEAAQPTLVPYRCPANP